MVLLGAGILDVLDICLRGLGSIRRLKEHGRWRCADAHTGSGAVYPLVGDDAIFNLVMVAFYC